VEEGQLRQMVILQHRMEVPVAVLQEQNEFFRHTKQGTAAAQAGRQAGTHSYEINFNSNSAKRVTVCP
jgi:hypothetical protein